MYRYKIKHNGVERDTFKKKSISLNFLFTVHKLDVDESISTFNLKDRNIMHS